MKYKVKSQLYADAEAQKKGKDQVLDDCSWSSAAAAVSWASGYSVDYSAAEGVAAFEKATGRKDKQGVSDAGGSLGEIAKTVKVLGGSARYAKSWQDAVDAAKTGAALCVWVQQPIGYPADVPISKWHDGWKRWWTKTDIKHVTDGYGHMTSAGYDDVDGWQWACPTRDEKTAAEKYAVPVTEAQLRQIANSKVKAGKVAVDYKCLLIVTHPGKTAVAPAPVVAPVSTPEPVAQQTVAAKKPVVAAVPASKSPDRKMALGDSIKPQTKTAGAIDPAVQAQIDALGKVDWGKVGEESLALAGKAADAAGKEKTAMGKVFAFVKYVLANSQIDEMALDAIRTFITVSLSVALGLGIPILDISGGDFRTVLSAGLASALQVVVKALDPNNSSYGVQKK